MIHTETDLRRRKRIDVMKVVVPTETKFYRDGDGRVRPCQPVHTTEFWERYLNVFDEVIFTGRIVDQAPKTLPAINNCRLRFEDISLSGCLSAVLKAVVRLRRLLAGNPRAAVCLRMPTVASAIAGLECVLRGRPFGVEVVGDPYTALHQPGGGLGLAAARWFLSLSQRYLCQKAVATAYVTEHVLQNMYPPGHDRFTTSYSTITLGDCNFRQRLCVRQHAATLINVGSMGKTLYKGQDVLIEAVGQLVHEIPNLKLALVGDGESRSQLERLVEKKGLGDRVVFCGHVTDRSKLESLLDEADLFAFPSRTEGLPKALIEAMARGLPAVGTRAGGIVELLPQSQLCEVGDVVGLARLIRESFGQRDKLLAHGIRNFKKAREFEITKIIERRRLYYKKVHEETARWVLGDKIEQSLKDQEAGLVVRSRE